MHPILLKIGPLTIYSYGVILAVAFIAATFLAKKKAREFGIEPSKIIDLAIWMMLFGIVGARINYVLLNLEDFVKRPVEIFYLHKGGLVFYGGFILAGLVGILYVKKNKLTLLDVLDLLAPYTALGYAIGRIGCLLNGCCWGKTTGLFWGISLPDHQGLLHPAQVYSSLGGLIIFLILSALQDRRKFGGQVFISYLMLYSIVRFFIEFLRGDNPPFFYNLTFSQLISAVVFVVAILFYIKICQKKLYSLQ